MSEYQISSKYGLSKEENASTGKIGIYKAYGTNTGCDWAKVFGKHIYFLGIKLLKPCSPYNCPHYEQ
jgi:hypothetical protein